MYCLFFILSFFDGPLLGCFNVVVIVANMSIGSMYLFESVFSRWKKPISSVRGAGKLKLEIFEFAEI